MISRPHIIFILSLHDALPISVPRRRCRHCHLPRAPENGDGRAGAGTGRGGFLHLGARGRRLEVRGAHRERGAAATVVSRRRGAAGFQEALRASLAERHPHHARATSTAAPNSTSVGAGPCGANSRVGALPSACTPTTKNRLRAAA